MNQKLQTIIFKAKEDIYNHLSGGNLSRILGQGYDFAELREYDSGDDIRHISWLNSAKLGEPYVKKMQEERELNVTLYSLIDGRFLVGDKLEILTYVLAVLAYSAYEANDLLTIINIDEKMVEPTKNLYTIENNIEKIYNKKILGTKIDYSKLSSFHLDAKQLFFLVGDFLDFVDLSILAQKHEVIAIIIRDEEEEKPSFSSDEQLIDPQTNQAISQTVGKRALAYYQTKLQEHDEKLFDHFNQHHIRYVKIYKIDEALVKLERLFL